MTAAVDTNILIDILVDDQTFYAHSKSLLLSFIEKGAVIVCPVVYAELLTQFFKKFGNNAEQKLEEFLHDLNIQASNFSKDDLTTAAKAWHKHTGDSKGKVACPTCGHENTYVCKKCQTPVTWRNHIIADFLIGAHAQNNADVFLTRDRGFYKKYYDVQVIS